MIQYKLTRFVQNRTEKKGDFLCSYQCLELKWAVSGTRQREVKCELYSESFAEVLLGMWASRLVKHYNLEVKRV